MIKSVFDIGGLLMSKTGEKRTPYKKHMRSTLSFFFKQKVIKFFGQKKKKKESPTIGNT